MKQEIFFHVGLSKTASTYLQNRFFDKLSGINYIGNHNYKNYEKILKESKDEKILVSREFDRQFDREVERFAKLYPNAGVIIVLRRHDSWMSSQYKRYVKNGGSKLFGQFFDLENNQGAWAIEDALFYPKLEKIEELFTKKPLVIFYNQIRKNIFDVFDKIAKYTGTSYVKENVNLSRKHKSYSEKQLKFVRKTCAFMKKDFPINNFFLMRLRKWTCHLFLYIGAILPKFLFSKKPLIANESLQKVKDYFDDDWQKCIEFKEKTEL